jgi:ribose transport system ATP-binding protein
MCGLRKLDSGEVFMNGEKLKIRSYSDAIKKGIAYLTEDRKIQGLFLRMKLKQNICATNLKKITKGLLINNKKESKYAVEYVDKLDIKTSSVENQVNYLSGGNQQKVMFAKWLYTQPKVFALDEPTRGIDVGAKSEIHNMLRDLCDQGKGIIVISSELPEIIGLCDRVIVMHEGKVVGEVTSDEINEHKLVRMASAI